MNDSFSLGTDCEAQKGAQRSAAEEALFGKGMALMARLFAHQHTWAFKVTRNPDFAYPTGYSLPKNANTEMYNARGWCFAESQLASFKRDKELVLDLGVLIVDKTRPGRIVTEPGYATLM